MATTDSTDDGRRARLVTHLPKALVTAIEEAVRNGHAEDVDSFVHHAVTTYLTRIRREEDCRAVRAALLATPVLTVSELACRRAETAEATERWMMPLRINGRLIAIPDQPDLIIPAFQITNHGGLVTVVAETNRILTISRLHTLWTKWAWWHSRTGFLSGASPIDLIHTAPRRIITAARRMTDPHGSG